MSRSNEDGTHESIECISKCINKPTVVALCPIIKEILIPINVMCIITRLIKSKTCDKQKESILRMYQVSSLNLESVVYSIFYRSGIISYNNTKKLFKIQKRLSKDGNKKEKL